MYAKTLQDFKQNSWRLRAIEKEYELLARLHRTAPPQMDLSFLEKEICQLTSKKQNCIKNALYAMQKLHDESDLKLQKLLYARFIDGLTWEQCAEKLDMSLTWVHWKWEQWKKMSTPNITQDSIEFEVD